MAMAACSRSSLWACYSGIEPHLQGVNVAVRRSFPGGVSSAGGPGYARSVAKSVQQRGAGLEGARKASLLGRVRGLSCSNSSLVEGSIYFTAICGQDSLARGSNNTRQLKVTCKRSDIIEAPERIFAALSYFLPLLDGIRYGRYLFQRFPPTQLLVEPFLPLIKIYNAFPFAPFIAFLALYLGVVQNQSFSRYVRFNTMQAIVLDVILILPSLVERVFTVRNGFAFELLVVFYNTVFVYLFACFVYGVGSCILGRTPRLPLVAEAADNQVQG